MLSCSCDTVTRWHSNSTRINVKTLWMKSTIIFWVGLVLNSYYASCPAWRQLSWLFVVVQSHVPYVWILANVCSYIFAINVQYVKQHVFRICAWHLILIVVNKARQKFITQNDLKMHFAYVFFDRNELFIEVILIFRRKRINPVENPRAWVYDGRKGLGTRVPTEPTVTRGYTVLRVSELLKLWKIVVPNTSWQYWWYTNVSTIAHVYV